MGTSAASGTVAYVAFVEERLTFLGTIFEVSRKASLP